MSNAVGCTASSRLGAALMLAALCSPASCATNGVDQEAEDIKQRILLDGSSVDLLPKADCARFFFAVCDMAKRFAKVPSELFMIRRLYYLL
jgi:hypothetical protein